MFPTKRARSIYDIKYASSTELQAGTSELSSFFYLEAANPTINCLTGM